MPKPRHLSLGKPPRVAFRFLDRFLQRQLAAKMAGEFGVAQRVEAGRVRRIAIQQPAHFIQQAAFEHPVEVARYAIPEAGVRDLELEPAAEVLTAAFATGGLRLVDLSGELRGDLDAQGREIAAAPTGASAAGVPTRPLARGARVLKGTLFAADMYAGLRTFRVGGP